MRQENLFFRLYNEGEISRLYSQPLICNLTQKDLARVSFTNKPITSPCLVKDIPNYLLIKPNTAEHSLSSKIIGQYEGYLVNLSGVQNLQDYLVKQLSKRNRKNLFSKKRKLEDSCSITYQIYYGEIPKHEFKEVLIKFYFMLKRRFDEKKIYNRYLKKWADLEKLVLQKIGQKEASLCVIKDGSRAIGITLNYHLGRLVLSNIQTYDIDYSSYNLGDILMLKNLEWCVANKIIIYDLSIGRSDFKLKWCNHQYRFQYQVFYDRSSSFQILISSLTVLKYRVKQYLRQRGIIGRIIQSDKLLYLIKNRNLP